jgi:hypothetical protein
MFCGVARFIVYHYVSCIFSVDAELKVQPFFLPHNTVHHLRDNFVWYSFQHTEMHSPMPQASQEYTLTA